MATRQYLQSKIDYLERENARLARLVAVAEEDWRTLEAFIAEQQIDTDELSSRHLLKGYRYVDIVVTWSRLQKARLKTVQDELKQRRGR